LVVESKELMQVKLLGQFFLTPLKYSVLYIRTWCPTNPGLNESRFEVFPHGPVVRSPRFQWRGLTFNPFIGELRSCKPWAKKIKNKAGLNEERRE
jgi:hypothetical protein